MTVVVVFEFVVATKETLTSNQRLHYMVKAKRTKAIRDLAAATAAEQQWARLERAHCFCHLSFGDNRRRDLGNYWPSAKAAIDGMVTDAGLLPDDDHTHLLGPDMRIGPNGPRGQVGFRFTFTEIE